VENDTEGTSEEKNSNKKKKKQVSSEGIAWLVTIKENDLRLRLRLRLWKPTTQLSNSGEAKSEQVNKRTEDK